MILKGFAFNLLFLCLLISVELNAFNMINTYFKPSFITIRNKLSKKVPYSVFRPRSSSVIGASSSAVDSTQLLPSGVFAVFKPKASKLLSL
jgi:hypothetical protein